MKQQLSIAFFALFLLIAGAAMAAGGASINSGSVDFTADGDGVVTVGGPDGFHQRLDLKGGHVSMGLFDDAGNTLADGTYTWQIQLNGIAPTDRSERPVQGESYSGAFTIAGGSVANPLALESRKDQVFLDDLIVNGSICAGFDCVNGENFGFDTLRLKENNLRIHFDDTSNSASFPSNDWRLSANDTSNGGLNHFSIEDSSGGKTPFRIEAGARTNALYVEADGDVGVGTKDPVVEMHLVGGNTPTLRLEQDGSNGFTPQTYDIAANETNFFIRDVTNGSALFFRAKPGAPENSIFIAASGNVGLGTASPDSGLDVEAANPEIRLTGSTDQWEMRLNGAGVFNFQRQSDGTNLLSLRQADNRIQLATETTAPAGCALGEIYVDDSGALYFCDGVATWHVAGGGGTCS